MRGVLVAVLWLCYGCVMTVTECMQRAGCPCGCVMAMLWLCYDCYRVHAACGVALWLCYGNVMAVL